MPEIKEEILNKVAGGTNDEVNFKYNKGRLVDIKKIDKNGNLIIINSKINGRGYEKQFHNIIYYHLAPIDEDEYPEYHGWYKEVDIDGSSGSDNWQKLIKPGHIVD